MRTLYYGSDDVFNNAALLLAGWVQTTTPSQVMTQQRGYAVIRRLIEIGSFFFIFLQSQQYFGVYQICSDNQSLIIMVMNLLPDIPK